jgi:serine phosphatase RsbU (regulator of sigma subunit)
MPAGHLPVRSYLGVPVVSRGEVLGGLFFGHGEPSRFGATEVRAAVGIAAHAAVAVQNARLYANQRAAAETLQRSLLPDRLPAIPRMELAARYLPGGPGLEVGGDWYDAFPLRDGALALVMGDVIGRGVSAASLMGQLRNGLRAYALEGHSPAAVIDRLNELACGLGLGYVATVVYGVLDPERGELRVANAGHPPPLLIGHDRATAFIDAPPGLPLGVQRGTRYAETTVALPAGTAVAFYTDGLVERRTSSLDEGLAVFERAASEAPADAEQMCAHILDCAPAGDGALSDDTALLVVRRLPIGSRVEDERDDIVFAAVPE